MKLEYTFTFEKHMYELNTTRCGTHWFWGWNTRPCVCWASKHSTTEPHPGLLLLMLDPVSICSPNESQTHTPPPCAPKVGRVHHRVNAGTAISL